MIPQKFKTIFDMVVALDGVQLRSDDSKMLYFRKLQQILNEPTLLSELFELDAYLTDYIKFMGVVYEALEESGKLSFDAIKDNNLAEKDYNRSWAIITLDENEYIKWGYGLKYSDFEKNIEGISGGYFDHFNQAWVITKEEMNKFLLNLNNILSFTYNKNTISKKEFIIKPMFPSNDLLPTNIFKNYMTKSDKFISDYSQLLKMAKLVDKFTTSMKLVFKEALVSQMRGIEGVDTKEMKASIRDKMGTKGSQQEWFDQYLKMPYTLKLQAQVSSKPWAKVNFGYQAMGLPFMLNGRVCEYYEKEAVFGDLRTTKTKDGLLYIIDTTKNTLLERGGIKSKRNLFIKKLELKKFPELGEQERYKNIFKEREFYKLKS